MNYHKFFLIFFFVIIFLFSLSFAFGEGLDQTTCFPHYVCGEWGSCTDGLSLRICEDVRCGRHSIVERKICEDELKCVPNIKCSDWGECIYTEKAENVLLGEIKFSGLKEKKCVDLNGCVKNFVEESPCSDSYPLNLNKITHCGEEYLSAFDSLSGKEVARIALSSWKDNKLNLIFISSDVVYCPNCFDGIKNNNEQGIDCGGPCIPCTKQTRIFDYALPVFLWVFGLIFSFFAFFSFFTERKKLKIKDREKTSR